MLTSNGQEEGQEATGPQEDADCRTELLPVGPSSLYIKCRVRHTACGATLKGCILPHAFAGSQLGHNNRGWSICST